MNKNSGQSFRKRGSSVFLKKEIRCPWIKLVCLLCVAALATVLYISGIGCVWRRLLGIQCPGCGMTRAVISLLRGDIVGAMGYNFMVVSLPVMLVYIMCDGRILKSKAADYAVLWCIAAGFAVRWVLVLMGIM